MIVKNISIQGVSYELDFSDKKTLKPIVVQTENKLIVHTSEVHSKKHNQIITEWLKQKAYKIIEERCMFYAKEFGFKFNRITIKSQITRWGSCSSNKNLNFNWKLVLAPPKVLEYVVIHELCHLIEMNHSARFWALVEKFMPDYNFHRSWLKQNGRNLLRII